MKTHMLTKAACVGLLSVASSLLVAACGPGGGSTVHSVHVTPGDMPSGATWTGVYFSPLYGHLHVVQEGNKVDARWMRPVKDRWGELHGEATGNVVHYSWNEYVVGTVGPNTKKSGRGYFKYERPAGDNVDDTIKGEIGPGNDESGNGEWTAIKQRNTQPDLQSIGGGGDDLGGGDWDKPKTPANSNPEAPKPPSP